MAGATKQQERYEIGNAQKNVTKLSELFIFLLIKLKMQHKKLFPFQNRMTFLWLCRVIHTLEFFFFFCNKYVIWFMENGAFKTCNWNLQTNVNLR